MNRANIALAIEKFASDDLNRAADMALAMGVDAFTFIAHPLRRHDGRATLTFLWDELNDAQKAAARQIRSRFGRAVMHAPFVDVPLVSPNPYIEREARRQIGLAVESAAELGVEVVTVHAPLRHSSINEGDFTARLVAALRSLGDVAARAGTSVGLENWRYPCDPVEHSSLLAAVDHPAVGATLDVGHIAYWYQSDGIFALDGEAGAADYNARLAQMIDAIGPWIRHLHVHDVLPADLRDHRGVGRGIIDFEMVMRKLAALDFDGVLLLELAEPDFEQATQESMVHLAQAMSTVFSPPAKETP
ncbi:TIM barrel protein [bacterium]|nr:TIM barrel protein [bacterium]